jgi:hypothetical protein
MLNQTTDNMHPIPEDTQNIIFSSLSTKTQTLLDGLA